MTRYKNISTTYSGPTTMSRLLSTADCQVPKYDSVGWLEGVVASSERNLSSKIKQYRRIWIKHPGNVDFHVLVRFKL